MMGEGRTINLVDRLVLGKKREDMCKDMRMPPFCLSDLPDSDVADCEDCPEGSTCCLANCNDERFESVCGKEKLKENRNETF